MTRLLVFTTLMLGSVLALAPCHAQERVVVALRAEATISAPEVLLGAVADLEAPAETAARLAAVSLSSAPLAGTSRVIEAGYVQLRLRRFGFNPSQVEVQGNAVTVHRAGTTGPAHASAAAQPSLSSPVSTSAPPFLIRRGQTVAAEVRCGGVAIRAAAVAMGDAALGDLVVLRREGSNSRLTGRVVGPGLVVLLLSEGAQ